MSLSKIGYKSLIIAGALTLFALPAMAVSYLLNYPPIGGGGGATWCYAASCDTWLQSFTASVESNQATTLSFWSQSTPAVNINIQLWNSEQSVMLADFGNVAVAGTFTFDPYQQSINFHFIAGNTYWLRFHKLSSADSGIGTSNAGYGVLLKGFSGSESAVGGSNVLALIIPAVFSPPLSFSTPTTTSASILSMVGDQFADTGFLAFAILASAIILGFWGMEKFLDMTPK